MWRMTCLTAILKIYSHSQMRQFILMFDGYQVKLIGLGYQPVASNDNQISI